MRIEFSERFRVPVDEVYPIFETPAGWVRVFGFPGECKDLGGGWFAVKLKNFPFPLEAMVVEQQPDKLVRWVFRGFWRGSGEVRFEKTEEGVAIEGFEEIAVRPLFFLSPIVERLFLERAFRAIWDVGWHRLRKIEAG